MKELGKYLLVGVLNTGVGYSIIFAGMYLLQLGPVLSNALGYSVGICVSYSLNKDFTFNRRATGWPTFLRFVLVSLIAYVFNLATLIIMIEKLHVHAGWSQIIAGVVYTGTSFVINKFYVFRRRESAE